MGRQRNEQTIADIRRAIWGLFVEQGYAKTSFSAVAQRAGLQRSIVQYYLSLIHISEPTRRTPISYAVFCLKKKKKEKYEKKKTERGRLRTKI